MVFRLKPECRALKIWYHLCWADRQVPCLLPTLPNTAHPAVAFFPWENFSGSWSVCPPVSQGPSLQNCFFRLVGLWFALVALSRSYQQPQFLSLLSNKLEVPIATIGSWKSVIPAYYFYLHKLKTSITNTGLLVEFLFLSLRKIGTENFWQGGSFLSLLNMCTKNENKDGGRTGRSDLWEVAEDMRFVQLRQG